MITDSISGADFILRYIFNAAKNICPAGTIPAGHFFTDPAAVLLLGIGQLSFCGKPLNQARWSKGLFLGSTGSEIPTPTGRKQISS